MTKAAKRLFICLDNAGYEASLERLKIYVALPEAKAERTGYLRIIDDAIRLLTPVAYDPAHRSATRKSGLATRPFDAPSDVPPEHAGLYQAICSSPQPLRIAGNFCHSFL